jgi:hypothetical protein
VSKREIPALLQLSQKWPDRLSNGSLSRRTETELAPSGDTFTTRAVEMQTHNGAIAQRDWTTEEWT